MVESGRRYLDNLQTKSERRMAPVSINIKVTSEVLLWQWFCIGCAVSSVQFLKHPSNLLWIICEAEASEQRCEEEKDIKELCSLVAMSLLREFVYKQMIRLVFKSLCHYI
jgi:hypothetical protein